MGRAGTRYWIFFLGTLFLGLILAAVSPGSLLWTRRWIWRDG